MNGGFIGGLIVGSLLGLLLGPAFRSWLVWREIESMRAESNLTDALLARLELNGERSARGLDPGRR